MEIIIDIPETEDRMIRKLKKEITHMTAAFDRLTAAVEANSDKVDELIAKIGEPNGDGTSDADVTALAELIEAKNAEIDRALEADEGPTDPPAPDPLPPVVTDPSTVPFVPDASDAVVGETDEEKFAAETSKLEAAKAAGEVIEGKIG